MKRPRTPQRTRPSPGQLSSPCLTAVKGALTNLELLALQAELQRQNEMQALLSNIMKTRHDTIKNTIANVR